MDLLVVHGRNPLRGRIQVAGAKNAAFKMIAASLLTEEEVVLHNMPRIDDVRIMIRMVQGLGVEARWSGDHTLLLRARRLRRTEVDPQLCRLSRCAIVIMGPLLAREGEVRLGSPGGDRIGRRPIDRHISALQAMGAHFVESNDRFHAVARGLRGTTVRFEKNTVMGTENVILGAVLARGATRIENAAEEPEVDDLICLLVKMGAAIERLGPRTIVIEGVDHLQGAEHTLIPDRNEAVTYAVAAAVAGGQVEIGGVRPQDLEAFTRLLSELGVGHSCQDDVLRVSADPAACWEPVTVETAVHPGFMTDWQAPTMLLLARAGGRSRIHETIYEDRFGFTQELLRMGADIQVMTPEEAGLPFDPEAYNFDWEGLGQPDSVAVVRGPTELRGQELLIPDLRAGATLVLAALGAEGPSRIFGLEHIDRGYEDFDRKLASLGAAIERLPAGSSERRSPLQPAPPRRAG